MKKHIDYYFLLAVILLATFGMLFLAMLSSTESLEFFDNANYYLFHQLQALAVGIIAFFIFLKIPLNFLRKSSLVLLFLTFVLLVLVFFPKIGSEFWGAKRWISIGSNTLQPSELLKITSILYLSAFLSSKFSESQKKSWIFSAKKSYHNFIKVFLPFLLLLAAISIILYFQRDVGTLGIISVSLLIVYFAAGTPLWHTVLTLVTGIAGLLVLIRIEPYRMQRLLVFLNPETDPLGIGLQLKQSLISMGSGGIFGKGLGMSIQKFGFLPQAMSDSTFAIIGEETGIIGSTILILLFLSFAWLGFKIARKATDKFSKISALGITSWIVFQAFINMASVSGLVPLSGVPLPFFSYGGSHLIAEMIGVGILLNISKNG